MVKQRVTLGCAMIALCAGQGAAFAQDTTLTDDLTTPQATSSTGSLTIADGGSITVTDLDALTIDSDSDVIMNGSLIVNGDGDGSAGIRFSGDRTSNLTINGVINVDSSLEREDDDFSLFDYPDNRFGVFLDAANSLTGDVAIGTDADIDIESDAGGGIILRGDLTGNFSYDGELDLLGDQSVGIELGNVSGDVTIGVDGGMRVTGQETDAVAVTGTIGGSFTFSGTANVTGFTASNPSLLDDLENQAELVTLQEGIVSGNGVILEGDVNGGVLIDGIVGSSLIEEDSDVTPGQTRNAIITVSGSGQALSVGNSTTTTTIGTLAPEEGLVADYGSWSIINRGSLTSNGVYDGIASETVRLENIITTAGIRNNGNVLATASNADAVGWHLTGSTSVPEFLIEQNISASVLGESSNATAVLIDTNASVPILRNNDRLSEINAVGDGGEAVAIRDLSGSVTSFTNSGFVTALQTDSDDETAVTIALDFSANTAGITITNTIADGIDLDEEENLTRSNFGLITGDIITGSGDDIFLSDARGVSGDIMLGAGNDTIRFSLGSIFAGDVDTGSGNDAVEFSDAISVGDLNFGAGDDRLTLSDASTWTGDLNFGAGTDLFELTGESLWTGTFQNTDQLVVTADNSSLVIEGSGQSTLTDLTLSNGSSLEFALSAAGNDQARIVASGTVTIDETSTLAFSAVEGFSGTIEDRLINAGTIDVDLTTLDADASPNSSFLIEETLFLDPNDSNSLILSRRRREANELGLFIEEESAFEPALDAIADDTTLVGALYGATTQEDFSSLFRQLLPEPLDLPITAVRAQNIALNSILSHRSQERATNTYRSSNRHLWLKEEVFYVNRTEGRGSTGFDGFGLLLAIGADTKVPGLDVLGFAASIASTQLDEKEGADFPVTRTTTGIDLYAVKSVGNLSLDGRFGWGWSSSDSERNVEFDDERRDFEGSWEGNQMTGTARLQYKVKTRGLEIIPTASIDYLSLEEDGYTENNLDDSAAFTVDDREADSLRVNSGLTVAWVRENRTTNQFSTAGTFGPSQSTTRFALSGGFSQELEDGPLTGTYRYDGGQAFTIEQDLEDSSYFFGGDMSYQNGFMRFTAGASANIGEETTIGSAYVTVGIDW